MSLMRWFRKNKSRIMLGVIFIAIIGFVGGSFLTQLANKRNVGLDNVVAHTGDGREITNRDLRLAKQDLQILEGIGANVLLANVPLPMFKDVPDLRFFFLGQLLFENRQLAPQALRRVKQVVQTNEYLISDKQVNALYKRSYPVDVYWMLLNKEASRLGIHISAQKAGMDLAKLIPQLFPGRTYADTIGMIIKSQGIAEGQILETFARLLAVLEYSRMICESENITIPQIMKTTSLREENFDVELVKFNSAVFVDAKKQPAADQIQKHFDKYSKLAPGQVSDENPYGFGYKIPERVVLEYIAIKLDDVKTVVTLPTQQESEQYYQKNKEYFVKRVPSDPNDSNSPLIEQVKSYAEMAETIYSQLLQEKTNSKAEKILRQALNITEGAYEDLDVEFESLTAEQFKEGAGDYKAAGEKLSAEHNIKVHSGRTGFLSAADIQADEYLGRMFLSDSGYSPLSLLDAVFATEEIAVKELGPFDMKAPKTYENFGPVKDLLGKVMAVMRIVETKKAAAPDSLNYMFSTEGIVLDRPSVETTEDIYSVKEKVIYDLRNLAAMGIAKTKAKEFVSLITQLGWDGAIDKFNELYENPDEDAAEPNAFVLAEYNGLKRISKKQLAALILQNQNNPMASLIISGNEKEAMFIDELYSLVPADANSLESVPYIFEFKPDMSVCVLKDLSIRRLDLLRYQRTKTSYVYREDIIQSQSMAIIHFNPENIIKRSKFMLVEQPALPEDANEPSGAGDDL